MIIEDYIMWYYRGTCDNVIGDNQYDCIGNS